MLEKQQYKKMQRTPNNKSTPTLDRTVLTMLAMIVILVTLCYALSSIAPSSFTVDYKDNQSSIRQHHQRISLLQQQQTQDNASSSSKQYFIPKTVWLYTQQEPSLFQQLNILNTKDFALRQNYTIITVNQSTYSSHLTPQTLKKITNAIKSTTTFLSSKHLSSNQTHDIHQNITKRLVIYALLKQNGGVFIDNSITIVQPLDHFFDYTLKQSQLINEGHKVYQDTKDYCIGFYNESYSSVSMDINTQNQHVNKWQFKPTIVLYPNLEDHFIACTKENNFIKKLFDTYVDILTMGKQWPNLSKLNTHQNLIGMTNPKLIYEHGHLIASHYILEQQQSNLVQSNPNSLAIHNLGLITINTHLAPTKLKTQFSLDDYKIYQYLAKLTVQQMEIAIGRLTGVFRLNEGVQRIIQDKLMSYENSTQFWVEGSFAHKFWIRHIAKVKDEKILGKLWKFVSTFNVLKNSNLNSKQINPLSLNNGHTQIQSSPKVRRITFDQTKPKWQSLQKNIWIIWDNGVEGKSNLIVELCYQNLKKSAQNSGFNIYPVSRNKIHEYLSSQMLQKIDKAIQNASFDLSRQAISDLWRMALIYEHGGVYFDASTFSVDQSFEWIVKLTQLQQNLVWNRYGKQPQVFMLWNTYYGCPLQWQFDQKYQTRSQWHLSYENNFIAASKGAELIEEWLNTMLQWIQFPYPQTQKLMEEVGMIDHKWTWDSTWHFQSGRYLTAMDSLKYVIGRRQMLLKQQKSSQQTQLKYINSAHYYKLWSIPGQFIGQQKLRGQTNYEHLNSRLSGYQNSYNTIYKYQFPLEYIQQVLGPISFQGKFFSRQLAFMNKLVNDFYLENEDGFTYEKLHELIHHESILGQKLFGLDPMKTVQLIKHYSKSAKMQRNFKGFSKVWIY